MSATVHAPTMVTVREAQSSADLDAVRGLMRAYAAEAGVEVCFQTLDAELKALPAGFSAVLVGMVDGTTAGCIALKALPEGRSEIVRLYVAPEARRLGLGRALVDAALDAARTHGRAKVVLHTLARWRAATALYRDMGFAPAAPYCAEPLDDVLFFECPSPTLPASRSAT
ncbi:MAG: GNAT family N-acetyltransferase [Alphaproteobacteria bacterium]|nr:GNAT family N-acetyltransferase [Alphaproteobacteria bacterium]